MSTTPSAIWNKAQPVKGAILDQKANVQTVNARMVQHHYVRAQIRNINANEQALIKATVDALRKNHPNGARATEDQLLDAFWDMTKKLQNSELAINFPATAFFSTPNDSLTYTQMYERASVVNSRVTLKSSGTNPAAVRIKLDNKATLGSTHSDASWGGVQRAMNPVHVGHTKTTHDPAGLNHTYQHDQLNVEDLKVGESEVHIQNPFFNPKTKEVFAALNYGRQPHGPGPEYGTSYFVLNKKYKTNALYFAGDTFLNDFGYRVAANDQISYNLLGGLYAKADKKERRLKKAIEDVCFYNQTLRDDMANCAYLLIEAHLFEPLVFTGGIDHIYLSRTKKGGGNLDQKTWDTVKLNAKDFARKHGAQLHVKGGFRFGS